MLTIEIDAREEASGIPRLLAERFSVPVRVRPLPVGDYVLGGLAVERKTSLDLARSIADGRAFDQARRLADAFPRAALVVEGLFPPPACDGREESYFGALAQLSWSFGLRVFPPRFPLDTAILLQRFAEAEFDRAAARPAKVDERRFCKPRHATDRRLFLLQGFFGVGPERARNLLHAFGSLRSVFCAPMEAWREVPGVGPTLARRMHELLNDESGGEEEQRDAG
ncbi:MAG: nuclease [Planctomycetia bacterium]|nr:nuclease [Planctomycetia bacterium]